MTRRLALFLAVAALAAAADKPNFTGSWKMNAAKSDFGPMPAPDKLEQTIKHEDPNLQVNSVTAGAQGEMTTEVKYTVDGKESVNTVRGMDIKSVAAWDGSTIVIKSKREMQGMEINLTEIWSLDSDGKVLTVVRKANTPQGDFELKTVMEKQ